MPPVTIPGALDLPRDLYGPDGQLYQSWLHRVEYKGQWYAFYHTSAISHFDWLRSVCVDKLFFNADGTIRMMIPTASGPGPVTH